MAKRRNITLSIDEETIRKARVLAAREEKSVSALLSETLEEIVAREDRWIAARAAALRRLKRPLSLGGKITSTRDQWHER